MCHGTPDQLTLFQPRGTDYAHLITTGTPGFSELPTALGSEKRIEIEDNLFQRALLDLKGCVHLHVNIAIN